MRYLLQTSQSLSSLCVVSLFLCVSLSVPVSVFVSLSLSLCLSPSLSLRHMHTPPEQVPAFLRTGDGAVELFDYAPVPEATCVADGSDTNQNCEVQADGNGCVDPSGCTFTAKTDEGFKAGRTPDYSNARLIEAMEAFVAEIGRVYDGDHRIAAFQVGLLGFWGEWHTHPHVAPDGCACGGIAPNGNPRIWIPQETKTRIAAAFTTAFSETQLELRYPYDLTPLPSELRNKFGFHDDSYAFNTLSEESDEGWFFWPQAVTHSATNNWKENMMGGETRPDIQPIVFSKDFAAGWPNGEWGQQDFNLCTETTHATYLTPHNNLLSTHQLCIEIPYVFEC